MFKRKITKVTEVENSSVAVALSFNEESNLAPLVAACGARELAKRMRRVACRFAVPLAKSECLAKTLSGVKVGEPVPFQTYKEVAQILTKLKRRP